MTMVEIAKWNNVSERTIYRYKTIFSWQEHAVRRVRQTSKSGLAGGWGGPNERI